jgi:hypothetical protein
MFNLTAQNLIMGGITLAGMIAIIIYKLRNDPEPVIKLYPPSARCEFCGKKALNIDHTCSQVKRLENCLIAPDHKHVSCNNCKAEYVQRMSSWYDSI